MQRTLNTAQKEQSAAYLKEILFELSMCGSELARCLGFTPNYILKILQAKKPISLNAVNKLIYICKDANMKIEVDKLRPDLINI